MTPAQRQAVEEFRRLRGIDPFGPFVALLKSPELLTRASALGEYLRYRSALPPRLSELVILITAAHWQQRYEWDLHAPIALEAGVGPPTPPSMRCPPDGALRASPKTRRPYTNSAARFTTAPVQPKPCMPEPCGPWASRA